MVDLTEFERSIKNELEYNYKNIIQYFLVIFIIITRRM